MVVQMMSNLDLNIWDALILSNYVIRIVVAICILLILKRIVKIEEEMDPHNGKVYTFFLALGILEFMAAFVEISGFMVNGVSWAMTTLTMKSFYLLFLNTMMRVAVLIALRHIQAKEFGFKDWIYNKFHF
jgi:hypothetical protein